MAQLIFLSIKNPDVYGKAYNLAGPEKVSYTEFVEMLKIASKESFNVHKISIDQIIRDQLPLPFPPDVSLLYDGKAIQQDIEFEYTPLVIGMSHTWRHYRSFIKKTRQQREMKS